MDTPSLSPPVVDGPHEALLTASQLAKRFAVSRNWVYQAVADDLLPHRRLGEDGPIRFVAAEIDEWLDAQRRGWMPGRCKAGKRGGR
jgi:excisionase family DNA binding protein